MPHRVDEGLAITLKRVASTLKSADIPFALGGSFAVYARGGYSSDHDVDFLIREQDKDRALQELAAVGFQTEQPPEDWLVKVYDEGRMADLIYRPVESPVDEETLRDTEQISVEAIYMPVLSATRLMIHKLLSYSQHYCDWATGRPLTAGADRLGPGPAGDHRVTVRRGVPGAAGPAGRRALSRRAGNQGWGMR
jgi:hypothetical protein